MMTLLKICTIKIYYELYNILFQIQNSSYIYCFCDKCPGCAIEHHIDSWCLIFSFQFTIENLNEQKKHPIKLLKL